MARKGTELATAYYSFLPSLDGTAAAVNSQMGLVTAAGSRTGKAGGAALGAGLIGGLKTAGVVGAALGIANLAGSITSYFTDAVGLASNLQESGNAVRVSYGEIAGEIDKLGETAAKRLGLSRGAFNDLAVRFSNFAGTIAGEGGDVVGVINDLTTRGADFASVYNLEVSDALGLFQSGLAGETEPLRRFGIDMSAAAVEAFALANGIGDGTGALTEAEKVQARYGLLLESTDKTAGDFAETQDSLANATRISNAKLEDAQAKVGEALLPAFEKFTDFMLTDGVPLVEKLVDVFVDASPAIIAVTDAGLDLLDFFLSNVSFVVDFFNAIEDGKITSQEAAAAIALLPKPLRDLGLGISGFFRDALAGVINFVSGGLNTYIGVLNRFLDLLAPIIRTFNQLFGANIAIPRINNFATVSFTGGGGGSSPARVAGGGRRAMADGGIVTARPGGIAATVGEGRYDEAVIPLSPAVLSQLGEAIGGGGGGFEVGVNRNGLEAFLDVWERGRDGSMRMVIENGKKVLA
jgi:hypothetical protein